MRHVVLALALAVSPLGPAVCEAACAHEAAPVAGMPGMPDCHMTEAADRGAGPSVGDPGDCRHPEASVAVRPGGVSAIDPSMAPCAPAVRLSDHAPSARSNEIVATHSPPPRAPARPLRV